MNITSNPWSFVAADVVKQAITSVTLNSDGTVTLVCASTTAFLPGGGVTIIDTTAGSGAYNGFYSVISGATTTYILAPQIAKGIPAGTGAGGAVGSALLCQYSADVRIEDLSWQNVPVSATLDVRDRNGNVMWQAASALASSYSQNRGKLFWVHGLSLAILTTPSVLIATVN